MSSSPLSKRVAAKSSHSKLAPVRSAEAGDTPSSDSPSVNFGTPRRDRAGSTGAGNGGGSKFHLAGGDSTLTSPMNAASHSGSGFDRPGPGLDYGSTSATDHPTSNAINRKHNNGPNGGGGNGHNAVQEKKKKKTGKKTVWDMIAMTVAMGGGQIAWVVELGYGTPYLLNLGLSESLTSLVWLAGPVSGLIAQPLIGAISDSSLSRFRRRYWIFSSTIVLIIAGLMLAFTEPIASFLVSIFQSGVAEWDPKRVKTEQNVAIGIAVTAFYALDFALNALQGSVRNLALDITPGEQLQSVSAWHARFGHIGNVVGFAIGSVNLGNVPILRDIGGGQFRRLCIVAIIVLVVTVTITCYSAEEQEREQELGEKKSKFADVLHTIYEAIRHLPKPVRRVCYVQIFAFMGWFPYLFYSTTWVSEVMATELGHDADVDEATRAGSLALLIYSCVAIVAGTVLPYLSARDHRLLAPEKKRHHDDDDEDDEDEEDRELLKIKEMVRQWKLDAARDGKALSLPTMPFMLRNIWTSSLLLFAVLMFATFFVNRVWQATVVIALVGICWAVACWVPFAIVMEFLKEIDDTKSSGKETSAINARRNARPPRSVSPSQFGRPLHGRAMSTPVFHNPANDPLYRGGREPTERTGLVRSLSTADIEGINEPVEYGGSKPAGGTIMGIHNLAIVFPQFLIAIISSFIFKMADGTTDGFPKHHHAQTSGVAWTLRFGGLCALVGALICRKVAPTKTEKAMRRRLAEMREESEEVHV